MGDINFPQIQYALKEIYTDNFIHENSHGLYAKCWYDGENALIFELDQIEEIKDIVSEWVGGDLEVVVLVDGQPPWSNSFLLRHYFLRGGGE